MVAIDADIVFVSDPRPLLRRLAEASHQVNVRAADAERGSLDARRSRSASTDADMTRHDLALYTTTSVLSIRPLAAPPPCAGMQNRHRVSTHTRSTWRLGGAYQCRSISRALRGPPRTQVTFMQDGHGGGAARTPACAASIAPDTAASRETATSTDSGSAHEAVTVNTGFFYARPTEHVRALLRRALAILDAGRAPLDGTDQARAGRGSPLARRV